MRRATCTGLMVCFEILRMNRFECIVCAIINSGVAMTVRAGLVGYGLSGQVFHAPLFEAAGVDLQCVASSNAAKVQADFPGMTVHPNYEALLADDSVDLVVLATPSELHAEQLLKALAAGKHVIAEKPFTTTVAEADDVIAAAKSANRIATCFQNRRWDGDFLTIRQLIDSDVLGDVRSYRAHFDIYRPLQPDVWREKPGAATGAHYDLGTHLTDQALTLFGKPDWVQGDLASQRPGARVVDTCHIRMGYGRNDLRVDLFASLFPTDDTSRFSVHGTKASYIKRHMDVQESQMRAGMKATEEGFGIEPESHWGRLTTAKSDVETVASTHPTLPGRHYEIYAQLKASIENHTPPPVLMEEARLTMRVIEAVVESSESGSRVNF